MKPEEHQHQSQPDPGSFVLLNMAAEPGGETERCPLCGSVISRESFLRLKAQIAAQEREKLAGQRARIEQEVLAEKESFQAGVREQADERIAAIAAERDEAAERVKELEVREIVARQQAAEEAESRVRAEAAEQFDALSNERDEVVSKLKESEEREQAVRRQAAEEAEARVRAETGELLMAAANELEVAKGKLKEHEVLEASIRANAAAEAEARVRAEAGEQLASLASRHAEAAQKLKELEEQRGRHREELAEQRAILEKDRDSRLSKLTAEHNREREKLQCQLEDVSRHLQHKTANELGDGAEIDVYEALKDTFVDDDIKRIKKGYPGADIRQKVIHKGMRCGTILLDSKNRQRWLDDYVTKLREDQITDKAEHAILSLPKHAFKADKKEEGKEFYIDEETGVIVASRAATVDLVEILREAMIRMHSRGLSLVQRAEKRELLYKYLTSEEYTRQTTEVTRLTVQIGDVDAAEKRVHEKTWEKRGRITTRLRNAMREINTEVSAIIEGKAEARVEGEASR